MKTWEKSVGLLVMIGLCMFYAWGCGSSSGGSNNPAGTTPTTNESVLTGQILASDTALASFLSLPRASSQVVAAIDAALFPVTNVDVWLEEKPEFKGKTNASGTYTIREVPAGNHRVVANVKKAGRTFKMISGSVSVYQGSTASTVPDIQLAEAKNYVTGTLRDSEGKPLPIGTVLTLWGESFTVEANGKYTSPPLPASFTEGEIKVLSTTLLAETIIKAPFISDTVPVEIETVVSAPGSTANKAPVVFLTAKKNGVPTSKVGPNEQLVLTAEAKDPESTNSSQLTTTWTADQGTLATSSSNPFQATWTAPEFLGMTNISLRVSDPQGASGTVRMRILVGLDQPPVGPGDTTAPTIVSVNPASGAANVGLSSAVSVTFSEFIASSTVNTQTFTLTNGGLPISGTPVINADGKSASFSPSAALPALSVVVARVNGVKDLAGNPAPDTTWTFETGSAPDTAPPSILSVFPVENATDTGVGISISLEFDEAIASSTISTSTFLVSSGTTAVEGTLSFSADQMKVTFTPSSPLSYGSTITVTVSAGVGDLAGNAMTTGKTWTFSTPAVPDVIPPTVDSIVPLENAVDVPIGSKIAAVFSEGMDPSTVTTTTFTVASGSIAIAGTVVLSSDGKTATFTPDLPLPTGSVVTVTITTGVKDLAGNTMTADKVRTFSTTSVVDTTPPAVLSVVPAESAAGVDIGSKITVNFSEAIDPSTLTGSTFTVVGSGTAISGTILTSADGKTATFTPAVSLPNGSVITVTITTSVKDLAGNAIAAKKIWTFSTTAVIDATPPTVVSVVPAENATGIDVGSKITVNFSEEMDVTTVNGTTFTLAGASAITGTVSISSDGRTATFTPSVSLPYGTLITATLTTGVKDSARNSMAANKTWTFTTSVAPDTVAPTVVSVIPAESAVNVATNTSIGISFSEAVQSLTLNATTFTVASGGTTISGSISLSGDGSAATFTPSVPFTYRSVISVTVTVGVKDLVGNPMATNKIWTFTVAANPDTTPPTITSVIPAENAVNVAVTTKITANFSEAVDPTTVIGTTFVMASGANLISGTIAMASDNMAATFTPSVSLPYGSTITVVLNPGVKDLAGNPLAVNKVWTFTTLTVDGTAPTVASVLPAEGASNVATSSAITAKFSEAIDVSTLTGTTFTVASGGVAIAGAISLSADKMTATFTPTLKLPAGSVITVNLTVGIKDLAGNPMAALKTWTFSTALDFSAPLLISEVSSSQYANSYRWVEVYNTTNGSLDLASYKLRAMTIPRAGGSITGPVTFTLPTLTIPANSYAVIRVKGSDTNIFDGSNLVHILAAGDTVPYWGVNGFVEIVDGSNQTVDFVRWGTSTDSPLTASNWVSGAAPALPNSYGSAIARPLSLLDTNTGNDWTLKSFPTPGGANDVASETDADGDGIPDSCEQSGATYMGLPLYDWGARVSQKDAFIQIDYMDSTDLGVNPRKEALDKVSAVFLAHGYSLHYNVGNLFGAGVSNHNLDNTSHKIAFSTYLHLGIDGAAANLYQLKAARLPLPNRNIFYYCIFGYRQNSGSTGLGEVNGNDFLISMGNRGFSTATQEDINYLNNLQAATFMHEFGHNLGLKHGGDEDSNFKPNYISVMNYLYSSYGIPQIGNTREGDRYYHKQWASSGFSPGSGFYQYFSTSGSRQMHNSPWTTNFVMEFSAGSGGALNEATLTESAGLLRTGSAGVDWNGNGSAADVGLNQDVNFNSTVESYGDFNDWGTVNIVFRQKSSAISNGPGGNVPTSYSLTQSDLEPIAQEYPVTLPHQHPK